MVIKICSVAFEKSNLPLYWSRIAWNGTNGKWTKIPDVWNVQENVQELENVK